jgi:hypothetical protein
MKYSPFILASLISAILPGSIHAVEQGVGAAGVAPASDEGRNAIKSFKVDPGIKIDLWAAEPMFANPVALVIESASQSAHPRPFMSPMRRPPQSLNLWSFGDCLRLP